MKYTGYNGLQKLLYQNLIEYNSRSASRFQDKIQDISKKAEHILELHLSSLQSREESYYKLDISCFKLLLKLSIEEITIINILEFISLQITGQLGTCLIKIDEELKSYQLYHIYIDYYFAMPTCVEEILQDNIY